MHLPWIQQLCELVPLFFHAPPTIFYFYLSIYLKRWQLASVNWGAIIDGVYVMAGNEGKRISQSLTP